MKLFFSQKKWFAVLVLYIIFFSNKALSQEDYAITRQLLQKYDSVKYYKAKEIVYNPYSFYNTFKNGKQGICNSYGEVIFEPTYDNAFMMGGPYYIIVINQKWGVCSIDGRILISPNKYTMALPDWNEDYGLLGFTVEIGRKKGYLGVNGEIIVPVDSYESVTYFPDEKRIKVKQDGEISYISYDHTKKTNTTTHSDSKNNGQGNGYRFDEITQSFFNTNKTYSIESFSFFGDKEYTTCEKGECTVTIKDRCITFKYDDGSVGTKKIVGELKECTVFAGDNDIIIPMYVTDDNCAVRAVMFEYGRKNLYIYTYNVIMKKYTCLMYYCLYW
jgi:hypothetical protein